MFTKATKIMQRPEGAEGRNKAKQRKQQPKMMMTTKTKTATTAKTNKTKKSQDSLKYVVLSWAGCVASCIPYFGKRGLTTDSAAKLHRTYVNNVCARECINKRLKRLTGRRSDELLANSSSATSKSYRNSSSSTSRTTKRSRTSSNSSTTTTSSTSSDSSSHSSGSTDSSRSTGSSNGWSGSGSDSGSGSGSGTTSYTTNSYPYDTSSTSSGYHLKRSKPLTKIPQKINSKERKTNFTCLKKRKPKRKPSQISYRRPIVNLDSDVEKRFADEERCKKIAALSAPPSSRPFNNKYVRHLV